MVDKARLLSYKEWLIERYAVSSVNSMLAALNQFLEFCGYGQMKVRRVKTQKNLFRQEEKELTYIFITHDLSVVKHISDDILVMYLGTVVEKCPSDALFDHPLHPYTKGLLSAIPIPSIHVERRRVLLQGELSSPVEPKPGCRFANRCPYATDLCRQAQPPLVEIVPEHFIACHHVAEINSL